MGVLNEGYFVQAHIYLNYSHDFEKRLQLGLVQWRMEEVDGQNPFELQLPIAERYIDKLLEIAEAQNAAAAEALPVAATKKSNDSDPGLVQSAGFASAFIALLSGVPVIAMGITMAWWGSSYRNVIRSWFRSTPKPPTEPLPKDIEAFIAKYLPPYRPALAPEPSEAPSKPP